MGGPESIPGTAAVVRPTSSSGSLDYTLEGVVGNSELGTKIGVATLTAGSSVQRV